MRALVVLCHPAERSLTRAAADAAVRGLRTGGHEVEVLDLYGMGFPPVMTAADHRAYHSDDPVVDPLVATSVAAVRRAEVLVFVYPTWWSSLPAMLKGWLEKTMVPGLAFVFDEDRKVRPGLQHIRRVVGITSYGSSRWLVHSLNDNGRRTLMRALRLNTGLRTRRTWLALYGVDTSTGDERHQFLQRIEQRMAAL